MATVEETASLNQEIAFLAAAQNNDPIYALTPDDVTLLQNEQAISQSDLSQLQPLVQGTSN